MLFDNFYLILKKISEMVKDFSLRELNTFGFDVKASFFKELRFLDDVNELLRDTDFISCRDATLSGGGSEKPRLLILSGGSNILFSNEHYDGFVVYPNFRGIDTLEENADEVKLRCYGGEIWKDFVDYTVSRNLYGLENLSDIPGKVGATPVQNIGAYGAEVKDCIIQVHTIDLVTGETKIFSKEECQFSYRNSIFKTQKHYLIFAVDFVLKKHAELKLDYGNIRNYLNANNITNPTIQDVASTVKSIRAEKLPEVGVVGSVGSFFQNAIVPKEKYLDIKQSYPEAPYYPTDTNSMVKIPSGWLIDKAGWKGHREGHVGVWDKQALVLVHYGGGKPQEILDLMKKIQLSIKVRFGIEIKPEVNLV